MATAETAHSGMRVIAHRGASGYAPENTLAAFERAVEMGAHALELDVQLSADGEVVVIHDPRVDRTTEGRGAVAELSLSRLKALNAGYRYTDAAQEYSFRDQAPRIPTLDEVLQALPEIPIVIELKASGGLALADAVASVLRSHRAEDRVIVASSCAGLSVRFRGLMPAVRTGFASVEVRNLYMLRHLRLHRRFKPPAGALMIPERYGPLRLITPGFVQAAKALGLDVHVWTVNAAADMQRLLAMGVDGLVTNYPDRLLEITRQQSVGMR